MQLKIKILSDKVLNGEKMFDVKTISKLLLSYGLKLKEFIVLSEKEKEKDINEASIFIMPDESIDDFISSHKIFYDTQTQFINSQSVICGGEFPVVIIPLESDILKNLDLVAQNIQEKFKLKRIKIFKIFGKSADECKKLLGENFSDKYIISGENLLTDIYLKQENDSDFISDDEVNLNKIFEKEIYSDSNLSMAEIIFKLMSISNQSLYIYDGFTRGELIQNLLRKNKNDNISCEVFKVINEQTFIKKAGETNCYIDEKEMVYQLALKATESKKANISIAICGKEERDGFKIFMAISRKNIVDVYNLFLVSNLEDAVVLVKDWAMFNLIKKLREKDFEN